MLSGTRSLAFAALLGAFAASCASADPAPTDGIDPTTVDSTTSTDSTPDSTTTDSTTTDSTTEGADEGSDQDTKTAARRELALRVRPDSDVASNPLPSIEVHDLGQDRMVNFRNIFPADRPVLLWMWAPY